MVNTFGPISCPAAQLGSIGLTAKVQSGVKATQITWTGRDEYEELTTQQKLAKVILPGMAMQISKYRHHLSWGHRRKFKLKNLGERPVELNLRRWRKEGCYWAGVGILVGVGEEGLETSSIGVGETASWVQLLLQGGMAAAGCGSIPGYPSQKQEKGSRQDTNGKELIRPSACSLTLFL